jgi:Domain of unknown function (DUF6434)
MTCSWFAGELMENVRRSFKAECGAYFKFDRSSMVWLKNGKNKA